jgi:hypothetical protein
MKAKFMAGLMLSLIGTMSAANVSLATTIYDTASDFIPNTSGYSNANVITLPKRLLVGATIMRTSNL